MHRVREFRQSDERAVGDSGDERLPDRHEAAEGSAEETQGRQPTVLTSPPPTVSLPRGWGNIMGVYVAVSALQQV